MFKRRLTFSPLECDFPSYPVRKSLLQNTQKDYISSSSYRNIHFPHFITHTWTLTGCGLHDRGLIPSSDKKSSLCHYFQDLVATSLLSSGYRERLTRMKAAGTWNWPFTYASVSDFNVRYCHTTVIIGGVVFENRDNFTFTSALLKIQILGCN
jgi:hypothetical protein